MYVPVVHSAARAPPVRKHVFLNATLTRRTLYASFLPSFLLLIIHLEALSVVVVIFARLNPYWCGGDSYRLR